MRRRSPKESQWISFSDMMTGLMVVFMFIALNYIIQVIEYKFIENEIYNKLSMEFSEEIESGLIELSPDGTVRFANSDTSIEQFPLGRPIMTGGFTELLNDFIPRYLNIVSDPEYIDYIRELRIEGHTDTQPPVTGEDSYRYNLGLSANRAQAVLNYLRNHSSFRQLDPATRTRMEFLFTANGLSFSRALNTEGEIAFLSDNQDVNDQLSRRVEFRVVTSNEKLIKRIFNEIKDDI